MQKTGLFVGGTMALALLSGCAAQVLSSTERSVVVRARIQDAGEAQVLAEAECKRANLHARLSGKLTANQYFFYCVN